MYNPIKDGQPITTDLAKELVGKNEDWNNVNPDKIVSVTFRASVFRNLLNQKNCDGIRIYYAKLNNSEPTLVMSGIDSNGNDLNVKIPTDNKLASVITSNKSRDTEPIIIEVGGGDKRNDFSRF